LNRIVARYQGRFSTRLMLLVALAAGLSTLLVTSFSWFQSKRTLERSLRGQGATILTMLEATASEKLLAYDDVFLRQAVTDLVAKEGSLSFAAVSNAAGVVIAHSVHALEGGKASDAATGLGANGTLIPWKGSEVLILARPVEVAGKQWGTVFLGVNFSTVRTTLRTLTFNSVLAGLVAILISGGIAIVVSRRNAASLNRLAEKALEISGGDLRTQVPEEGYDELKTLARAFNAMADTLRTVLRQIQESGGKIGDFSQGITRLIQEQATAASQQATSLAEVTATMEELSRTSHQIAGNADAVKERAEQTVDMAQQGTSLVRESVEGMGRIKERVTDIAQKTLFLGEKSREIGKVMDLIKEIAGEIHLLALNAAIESAAAGEHGRRFAVVASEVRRLAEKTRESTESIRSLVSEIQSATQGSIQATEQGSREVDKWRETINLTAGAFEEIIGMIEKTSETSTMISMATNQQTNANDQVVSGMRQVAEMVRVTAAHMKESSASAAELREMAGMLTEKAAVFRV
jgi:methyl-accepting chemotaxis protein